MGGLLGGVWLAHLLADLGDGRFDGAWLAQNFENLKPEKTVWEKYANLFSNIDTESERFLEFERWRNGFYFLSREEILAIVESLDDIEALAPGLYEMKIDNPTGDPDCDRKQYSVRFETRDVEDLPFKRPQKTFERVREVSEFNESIYRTFLSPWIRLTANPLFSDFLKWAHPMRASRYWLSERFNPWMLAVSVLAEEVAKNRDALPKDHSKNGSYDRPLITNHQLILDLLAAKAAPTRSLRLRFAKSQVYCGSELAREVGLSESDHNRAGRKNGSHDPRRGEDAGRVPHRTFRRTSPRDGEEGTPASNGRRLRGRPRRPSAGQRLHVSNHGRGAVRRRRLPH